MRLFRSVRLFVVTGFPYLCAYLGLCVYLELESTTVANKYLSIDFGQFVTGSSANDLGNRL